jgi:hypothetical protein
MDYYQILGGVTTTVLTLLFGVLSLAPLVTRPDGEPAMPDGLLQRN